MPNWIAQRLSESAQVLLKTRAHAEQVEQLARAVVECLRSGKKVVAFGNGGSAADAEHLSTELVVRFLKERHPLPALALTTNTPQLTAIANDYGYEEVFARQVEALVNEGDVAVGITTSGQSLNVLKGLKVAKARGATTAMLTGEKGSAQAQMPYVDVCVVVPSDQTPRIQEAHTTILHIVCEAVDEAMAV